MANSSSVDTFSSFSLIVSANVASILGIVIFSKYPKLVFLRRTSVSQILKVLFRTI